MGQAASQPGPPSTPMRVLALGLPRTGTSSMSAALEILFSEPSYHGGAQLIDSSLFHMRRWLAIHRISLNSHQSGSSPSVVERQRLNYLLARQFEGFASCSDTPTFYYAAELISLYPSAKVIVTVRDKDSWWKSKVATNTAIRYKWLPLILWPVPAGIRYWPELGNTMLAGIYAERYFEDGETISGPQTYDRHMAYLKRVVPKDKLYYFNVKDGWGPLCKILGVEVPDVPFPHLNETAALHVVLRRKIQLGLTWWAVLLGILALCITFIYHYL